MTTLFRKNEAIWTNPLAISATGALALAVLITLCLDQTIPQLEQNLNMPDEDQRLPETTETTTQASPLPLLPIKQPLLMDKKIKLMPSIATQKLVPVWHPCIATANNYLNQHPVLFEAGKTYLRAPARTRLTHLSRILSQCPDTPIRIMGHTDAQGHEDSNLEISLTRAKKTLQFMVAQGLSGTRLSAGGAGSSQPASNNKTATGQALNRRIELVLQEN